MAKPVFGRKSPEASPIRPESVTYFHGKITRDQAEAALMANKAIEGMFLLRESVNQNYAISICHDGRVHHYNIEKQPDGTYQIPTGWKFPGPVELVHNHMKNLDGFLTLARVPLERAPGETPVVLQGVRSAELEEKLRLKAMEMGLKGPSVQEALSGPMRDHIRYLVLKDLHFLQPWYHDSIRRRESERRLQESGAADGSFLVRYRKDDGSYVLSLTFEREPRHYKIEQHLNKLSIEGGQYFETLMEMIDHYHFRQDGLLCKLRHVVEAPDFARSRSGCSSVSSEFLDSHLKSQSPVKRKDRTASVGGVMAGVAARTASHSLPSLSSLVTSTPVTTAVTTTSSTNGDQSKKTANSPETPSKDLISFNDWPNVSLFLASQQSNNGMKSNGQKLPKPILPMLHPVQLSTNEIGGHTPFTPITPCAGGLDGSPTPKPVASIGSPTSPFSRAKLKTSSPTKPSPPPLPTGKQFSLEEFRAGIPPRSFSASAAFPTLPLVAPSTTATTTTTATITNTLGLAGSAVKSSAAGSRLLSFPNNSLPPESLHCPPIIDAPWEELDGSEDRSLPGSSSGSTSNPDVLPLPPPPLPSSLLGANPFLKSNSPTVNPSPPSLTSTPPHHVAGISTFCNSPCCRSDKPQSSATTSSSFTAVLNNARSVLSPIEEAQQIYDSLPDSTFFLNPEHLSLMERLGGGNFGQVVKGIYRTPHGQEVPVAVKTLKESQIASTGEQSILSEAKMMTQLKHRHIVRLIGVSKAQRFMLVLELAPLGPINKFLKKHPDTTVSVITELMYQVAQGMAYLESCKFVHRDLAARNVLLVTQRFAKISDFGMSKALNFGNDYYRAASAGKWPLKWYAPECIYYFRFDSKSDVWSYGITLWEVFSFGERPYKDMKGAQILSMLDQGLRLSRPPRCPEAVYAVMQECWNFEGVRRPTFAELVLTMSRLSKALTSSLASKEGSTSFPPPPPLGFEPVSCKSSVIPSTTGGSGGSGVNSSASDMAFF